MTNPNPDTSGLKPFAPGESGNPGGKTSAQRKAEVQNAEKATLVRSRLLDAMIAATESGVALDMIESSVLKLIKDSEDRGLGTPVQSVNVESPNGTMSPTGPRVEDLPLDVVEALMLARRSSGA